MNTTASTASTASAASAASTASTASAASAASRTVLIVGAGPGGLTLAAALQRNGIRVKVFERNTLTLEKLGGSFALSSGRDWLDQIGFKDEFEKISTPLRFARVLNHEGEKVGEYRFDLPGVEQALNGHVMRGVARSELVNMLNDRLEAGVLQLGCELKSITESADGLVTAHLLEKQADGSFHPRTETGAIIIGADGINSKVRSLMYGPRAPRETNTAAYVVLKRDIKQEDFDFSNNDNQGLFSVTPEAGTKAGFVGYPSSPGTFECVYHYELPVSATAGCSSDSWSEGAYAGSAQRKKALEMLHNLPDPLGFIARQAEDHEIVHIGLHDRAHPELAWNIGRVGMIGDAAHAVLPTAGQGANSAIGDGAVLAKYLAAADLGSKGEVEAAFRKFEEERRAFGEQCVKQGRDMFESKLANYILPQIGPTMPNSKLSAYVRNLMIKFAHGVMQRCPKTIAKAIIADFKKGCGKADIGITDTANPTPQAIVEEALKGGSVR